MMTPHLHIIALLFASLAPTTALTPSEPALALPQTSLVAPLTVASPTPLPTLSLANYPVAAPNSYANSYDFGNCTAYVASRIKVPDNWGNANTWAERAIQDGYTVGRAPVVGAIAQSTAGQYGHVAIVTAVDGNQVQVSEMNVEGLDVVDSAWYATSFFNYIYI